MNSPFAGMDPYIESSGLWRNFHANLLIKIQDALADVVPNQYLVRAEERSYLLLATENGKEMHNFYPDIRVIEPQPRPKKRPTKKRGERQPNLAVAASVTISAEHLPMKLAAFVETEVRETFIEIFATEPEHRLVTTIEVLSPTNKDCGSHGWNLYLRKRQAALVCGVHLIEIDLLRGGTRMPMRDPWPGSPFTLLVARAGERFACDVWPAYFHVSVPPIPVPLSPPDPDVTLALQPLIDSIYRRLRYAETIDYEKPLLPAPSPAEATLLKQAKK